MMMEKKHLILFYVNRKWIFPFLLKMCIIFQVQNLSHRSASGKIQRDELVQKIPAEISFRHSSMIFYQQGNLTFNHFNSLVRLATFNSNLFKKTAILLKRVSSSHYFNTSGLLQNTKNYESSLIFLIFLRSYRLRPPPLSISVFENIKFKLIKITKKFNHKI